MRWLVLQSVSLPRTCSQGPTEPTACKTSPLLFLSSYLPRHSRNLHLLSANLWNKGDSRVKAFSLSPATNAADKGLFFERVDGSLQFAVKLWSGVAGGDKGRRTGSRRGEVIPGRRMSSIKPRKTRRKGSIQEPRRGPRRHPFMKNGSPSTHAARLQRRLLH